jgi:hypothetical protein
MVNYQLKVEGQLGGQRSWTIGWHCTATASATTVASTLDSAWNTLWTTATAGLANFLNAEVTTVDTVVSTMNSTWRQTSKIVTARALAGTNANPSLPWNSSVTITHLSGLNAKNGRGRIELPCLSNDNLTSHVYLDATLGHIATIFGTFFTSLSGLAGFNPVVFNRRPLKDGTPAFQLQVLQTGEPSNKPGTVRARTRKVLPVKAHTFAM